MKSVQTCERITPWSQRCKSRPHLIGISRVFQNAEQASSRKPDGPSAIFPFLRGFPTHKLRNRMPPPRSKTPVHKIANLLCSSKCVAQALARRPNCTPTQPAILCPTPLSLEARSAIMTKSVHWPEPEFGNIATASPGPIASTSEATWEMCSTSWSMMLTCRAPTLTRP